MEKRIALTCCCDEEGPQVTNQCQTWIAPMPTSFAYSIFNARTIGIGAVTLPTINGVIPIGNCGSPCGGAVLMPDVQGETTQAALQLTWAGGTISSFRFNVAAVSSVDVQGDDFEDDPCKQGQYDPNDNPVVWRSVLAFTPPARLSGSYQFYLLTGGTPDFTYPYDLRSAFLIISAMF